MSSEAEPYLAVLKASYDYEPQSEDEIAIKENQIVFLTERVDDDWWKVKVKTATQDEEGPVGLVPAAWLEQADHSSVVKALYDYEASAPGELSISEDEILLAFDTDEEWMLVQSTKEDGKAGYVPANYVEPHSQDEEAEEADASEEITVPPSPPRPISEYVDPADRVAASKANADDIKTWSVSEVDKKGKKMKGTLGIGNGAVFFASETSKAAVQKWQTADITHISTEKSKHVHFDVGGANPISLHFHVGSKDNADAIVAKLESSRAASASPGSETASPTRSVPPVAVEMKKKPSVHFSPASPVIIPPREDDPEEYAQNEEEDGEPAVALYDFTADQDDEMSVVAGESLLVLEKDEEWWKCRSSDGREGVVPASYVELRDGETHGSTRADDHHNDEEVQHYEEPEDEEEDVAAAEAQAEAERQAKAEAEAAAAEAKRRAKQQAEAEAQRKREQKKAEEEAAREKERKKQEAQQRAKAAAAAEEERRKRKEAAAIRAKTSPSPPTVPSNDNKKPTEASPTAPSRPPEGSHRVRVWHDRTGQFRADAVFLGFKDGKIRLHKTNGVIVEVPVEKISSEDMRYVEKITNRKSKPTSARQPSDDDVPLAIAKRQSQLPPKKGPEIDWFDFFLSAGCDMHDCTRYAASFERDKIDESILADITESTMRSLGLREGDIIRVTKAIAQRYPNKKAEKEQNASEPTKSPPNLFTNPGGELKQSLRRGRPQPKNTSNTVDLIALGNASEQIQRTSSPQAIAANGASPVQPPPRASSAIPVTEGFEDEAWTVRSKPLSPQPAARAPSAPPATTTAAASAPPAPAAAPDPSPAPPSTQPAPVAVATTPPSQLSTSPNSLAKTTESDIFDQLARLSELRKSAPAPTPPVNPSPQPIVSPPPVIPVTNPTGFQVGLGMGSSPVPMGQIQTQHLAPSPPLQQQMYNGPRGPFAPVPANQSLLQPLIPTQTGFNSFIPTRPTSSVSPFQNPSQPSLMAQPTGFTPQPMLSQPTGIPFSNMNGFSPAGNFGGIATNPTGFGPSPTQPFGNANIPPVPPLPSSTNNNNNNSTNPANIFAQMKSGTFAMDQDNTFPQAADKYDPFRPTSMLAQPTGWGGYQGGPLY